MIEPLVQKVPRQRTGAFERGSRERCFVGSGLHGCRAVLGVRPWVDGLVSATCGVDRCRVVIEGDGVVDFSFDELDDVSRSLD